jgi:hypothetical protein
MVVGEGVGVKVGEMVAVGLRVIVPEGEAVPVGGGGAMLVSVGPGAASTFPPQAVNNTYTTNIKKICCFIRLCARYYLAIQIIDLIPK